MIGRLIQDLERAFTAIVAALIRLHADRSPTQKKSYHVHFFQEDGWWLARVGEYDILTQGKTLAEAMWMTEDLIRCHEEPTKEA